MSFCRAGTRRKSGRPRPAGKSSGKFQERCTRVRWAWLQRSIANACWPSLTESWRGQTNLLRTRLAPRTEPAHFESDQLFPGDKAEHSFLLRSNQEPSLLIDQNLADLPPLAIGIDAPPGLEALFRLVETPVAHGDEAMRFGACGRRRGNRGQTP